MKYTFTCYLFLFLLNFSSSLADQLNSFLSNEKFTSNQKSVIKQLNALNSPSTLQQEILFSLENLPLKDCQYLLNQLSGDQYATLLISSELSGSQFLQSLYNPLRSKIITDSISYSACDEPNFSTWTQIFGGQAFINHAKHQTNPIETYYNVELGGHKIINHDWNFGVAVSYKENFLNFKESGNGKSNYGFGGIYMLYRPIGYYIFADVGFGRGQTHLKRQFNFNEKKYYAFSQPKTYQGVLYFESGMDCTLWNLMVQPFLGFEANIMRHSYVQEDGNSPFKFMIYKKTAGNVYSRVGSHITFDHCCYLISLDLVWKCRLNSSSYKRSVQFKTFGTTFSIKDFKQGQDYFEGALAINTKLWDFLEFYGKLSGMVGDHTSCYNVLGGLEYTW